MTLNEIKQLCDGLSREDREEFLLFIRLLKSVPKFREELHTLAAPGKRIPSLEITEGLMEKYKGELSREV